MIGRTLFLFLFLCAAARADVADFYGNWENAAQDATGITHIAISPAGGNQVSVRVYGNCHPTECNWGLVDGKSYTIGPRSGAVESIVAVINAGFARRQIIFHKGAAGQLLFEVLTDFSDGTGRRDFDMTGTLKPSTWAGPVNQAWEHPAGMATGWGGGARTGVSPSPKETCTDFDMAGVRAVRAGPSWKIVSGGQVLVEAGSDEHIAQRIEATIRFYHFDRKCTVGGPANTYWKRGAVFAHERMGGADCISFNPTTVHAAHIGHSWKIVDGVQWIASFADDKAPADALLSLIRSRHLDAECFVARPNPAMVYWLSY